MLENLAHVSGRAEFTPGRITTERLQRRPAKNSRSAPTTVVATKRRTIYMPNGAMIERHRELIAALREMWELQGPTPWVTGARPGSSPVRNVLVHAGNRFVLTLDLRDAYDAVQPERLIDIVAADYSATNGNLFATERERRFVADIIGDNCACFGGQGLRTGAPSSPDLFNRYALELLDRPIMSLANRHGFRYSRYLDDLTFSRNRPFAASLRRSLREIVFEAGFQLSWRKAGNFDLERQGAIHLNGIGLKAGGQLYVPRPYLRKVSGLVTVAHHSHGYGAAVTPEVVMGHVGVIRHIMSHQLSLWTATDLRFIDRVNAYRRSLGHRPLEF